jgi:hypothetical protein
MTVGPVTANWFLSHTGLAPAEAREFISILDALGALERIDLGRRATGQPAVTRVPPTRVARLREMVAQRFAWRDAAVAVIVCLGVSAALDYRLPQDVGTIALPHVPAISG